MLYFPQFMLHAITFPAVPNFYTKLTTKQQKFDQKMKTNDYPIKLILVNMSSAALIPSLFYKIVTLLFAMVSRGIVPGAADISRVSCWNRL